MLVVTVNNLTNIKKILIIFYLIKLYIFSTINWYGVFT